MNSEIIRESKIQINKAVISDFLRGTSIEMFSFVLGLFILRETNSALGFALTEFLGPVLGIIFTPAMGSSPIFKTVKRSVKNCWRLLPPTSRTS